MKKFLLIFCCLVLKTAFTQTPGSLDLTFGTNGIVLTPAGISDTYAKSILLLPDGKIIISGETNNGGSGYAIAIGRYNPDGTPDITFGTNGITLISTPGLSNFIFASSLLPDGKILVGGGSAPPGSGGISRNILARFNPDGNLDTTFGIQGLVYTQITNDACIYALALQSDGKIIAAGTSNNTVNSLPVSTILRYDSLGNLDPSFGNNGIVTTLASPFMCQFTSVGLLTDGKIIAAGTTLYDNNPYHSCFLLVRYLTDGSLDSTFGINGIDLSGKLGAQSFSFALKILPDGKSLLAGRRMDDAGGFAVAKYNPDGGLDTTFGTGGSVATAVGDPLKDVCRAMTAQPDGKILLTGIAYPASGIPLVALIRYTANGTPDNLFGTNGITTADMGFILNYANGIALQPDGKILISSMSYNSTSQNKFVMARFIGGDYPVGLPVSKQNGTLTSYPNPVIDHITIETASTRPQGNLVIYNVAGEEMLNLSTTSSKIDLNVSNLEAGIYFIKLTDDKGVETGRFIKID